MQHLSWHRAVLLMLVFHLFLSFLGAQSLDLSGEWRFQLDPEDQGESAEWFDRILPDTIKLPGCLQAQGFGEEISIRTPWTGTIVDRSWFTASKYEKYRRPDHVKIPFWLQPDHYYKGAAWYQKSIRIPAAWKEKRILLRLERPHWKSSVWIDRYSVGNRDSLSTPHVYEVTPYLSPGEHQITIRVDNRMIVDVGENAHSVTDHTQSNWNGIVGDIELSAGNRIWLEDIQVFPDAENRAAVVAYEIGNRTGKPFEGLLRMEVRSLRASALEIVHPFRCDTDGVTGTVEVRLAPDAPLWDEFNPALHRLWVQLETGGPTGEQTVQDSRVVKFGIRNIATDGTEFLINRRRAFMRGTLECAIFPLTGYPPADVREWKRIIRQARAFGLNHMRFHSWCPPEAAFTAADQLGFYLQVECAAWTKIGDGEPIDAWIYAEGDRILREYGNHPSFLFLAYGNEPSGKNQKEWLAKLVAYWKKNDPRRLYTSAAGWPLLEESDFHSTPQSRIQHWGEGNRSRINFSPPETETDYREFVQSQDKPVISHEIGQWCVYPNFEEIKKYRGHLKPKNFEIFQETLSANHMGDLAEKFLIASGNLQVLCYKEEIESALRTPGFGGFQLLDLHDFPGQGTALVGVLDPFWDEKPYISAAEYRRFCNVTVPLARMAKRIWTGSERFSASLEVAHFGREPIEDAVILWRLVSTPGEAPPIHGGESSNVVRRGRVGPVLIPIGNGKSLAGIEFDLQDLDAPARYRLAVEIEGTPYANDWDIWVYPDAVDNRVPEGILMARSVDRQVVEALRKGGKVLLMPGPGRIRTPVKIGFSAIFWNTAWTRNQPPHTLGILCDPKHPSLREFPTEFHSNWQWWDLTNSSRAAAMVMDHLPPDLRPIIQPIDTWFENRRLGLLYEAAIESGRILVCSMDLEMDLDRRPVARQMRSSLLQYMQSPEFQPQIEISVRDVAAMIRE